MSASTRRLASLFLSISFVFIMKAQIIISRPDLGDCELAFEDNFDGLVLDANKWQYRTDSKHWSTQLPENVAVKDGYLYLNVKKQTANGMNYTGAGVISKQLFKFGYYESRFKIPAGGGWHTSFWLMGFDGSGGTSTGNAYQEIDICENDSKNYLKYATNVHNWLGTHTSVFGQDVTTPDLRTEFHTWGCDFSPTKVKFYFEGNLVRTVDVSKQALNENNIWLTTIASYIGGTTSVDETQLPSAAVYDYVRYYRQLNPVLPEVNPSDTSTVAPNPSNPQIIIDNTDAACSFDVTWTQSTYNTGFYGTNYAHDGTTTADPAKWAKWTPTIPATGYYNIYMRWPAAANRAKAAPVEIQHGEGTTTVTVDQTINNASWRYLGNFLLMPGTGSYVKISASSEGYTMADAVLFELTKSASTGLINQNSDSFGFKISINSNDINATFNLQQNATVSLVIYNASGQISGKLLNNNTLNTGKHNFNFTNRIHTKGLHLAVLYLNGKIIARQKLSI